MEAIALENLRVIWNYMRMSMELRPADCIVGFGSYSEDVAVRAAELYKEGYSRKLLFSGGLGRNTSGLWTTSEAERFARIAIAEGVPARDVLIENRSTNTGENIEFTRALLAERGLDVKRIIAVHKPYMERRIFAALGAYWPEVEVIVTSPQVTLEACVREAVRQGLDERTVIDVIVGDFQRIDVYARRGYQIPQFIPEEVNAAYREMVRLGYTSQLI